jgi:hypothetical protein
MDGRDGNGKEPEQEEEQQQQQEKIIIERSAVAYQQEPKVPSCISPKV